MRINVVELTEGGDGVGVSGALVRENLRALPHLRGLRVGGVIFQFNFVVLFGLLDAPF